jgi:cytochrome c-type biogenesis protein CcmH/NrfG
MALAQQNAFGPASGGGSREHRLADCYERAMHLATHEKNFNYAHVLFAQCVRDDPGNPKFVDAMVQNLRTKARVSRKSIFGLSYRKNRSLRKAIDGKDWKNAFGIALELLSADPWNVATLRGIAEACAGLHYNEAELIYLKQALDAEPKNIEVSRHCARSLARLGQFDQAIACWHRVEKLRGKDEEAARMVSFLAQEKLRYPGGRPSVAKPQETPKVRPEQETVLKEVVLSPQQKLEEAIATDPQNLRNYLELAQVLLNSNRLNAAESVLTKGIAACGEQAALLQELRRVRTIRAEEDRQLTEDRALAARNENRQFQMPWMELALASAFFFLILQLVPSVRAAVWRMIDFRQWSRYVWFAVNFIIFLGLAAVRFGSNIRAAIRRKPVRKKVRTTARNR